MGKATEIGINAKGADRAKSEINGVGDSLGKLKTKGQEGSSVFQEMGRRAIELGVEVARAFTDIKPIDFSASANQARNLDESITRLGLRSNQSISQLTGQIRDVSVALAQGQQSVVDFSRQFTERSMSAMPADQIKEIGEAGNNTGRQLFEMLWISETMFKKLNVSASRLGEGLRTIHAIARDASLAGGAVALEQALTRSGDKLAHLGGGLGYKAGVMAELGRGLSQDVAASVQERVMSRVVGSNAMEWQRFAKNTMGVNAFQRDEGGRVVLKPKVFEKWIGDRARKIPFESLLTMLGNDFVGMTAATQILGFRAGRAKTMGAMAEKGAIPLDVLIKQQQEGQMPTYLETEAGAAAKQATEREQLDIDIGRKATQAATERRRLIGAKGSAILDTAAEILPDSVQKALTVVEAGVAAVSADQRQDLQPVQRTPTVKIDEESIRRLAEQIKDNPPIVQPSTGQQTNDRKQATQ